MRKLRIFIPVLLMLLLLSGSVLADADIYTNPDTGYRALIEDDADLLSEQEENEVLETMIGMTEYGDCGLKTISDNPKSSAKAFAEAFYYEKFQNQTGVVFLIDMENRELYLAVSDGEVHDVITDAKALTVVDNVYTMASRGDYAGTAEKVFSQCRSLMRGGRIAQPMKYICNALLALIIGLVICFEVANKSATPGATTDTELITAAAVTFAAGAAAANLVSKRKTYSSVNSGSSGGGGGFHSSGGGGGFHSSGGGGGFHSSGGGGGFHGGGGGHKF